MKLIFWPMLIFAAVQSFFFREREDFFCIKLRGILLAVLLIPIIYYTYNGAIGKSHDFINIGIFFVSAAIAFIYEVRLFNTGAKALFSQRAAIGALAAMAIAFVLFTYITPELALFEVPK